MIAMQFMHTELYSLRRNGLPELHEGLRGGLLLPSSDWTVLQKVIPVALYLRERQEMRAQGEGGGGRGGQRGLGEVYVRSGEYSDMARQGRGGSSVQE